MASTYTANQGIEKMDTGDQSGTWGGTVNTNMDIIDRAISGVGALTLTGSTTTLTTTDGTLTDGMYRVLVLGDGGDLGSDNTITLSPNDQDKAYLVYNNLSANRNAIFSQGTGANATVQNGETAWIYADGAGSGAAVRTAVSSVKITDQDGDTQIQVEEGGDDDDTIRFYIAGAEDCPLTANTFNVLSGSTLDVNSGATITNNGTSTGFGADAERAFAGVLQTNSNFIDQVIFGPSVDGMPWNGLWSKASVFSSLMLATIEDEGSNTEINIWDLTEQSAGAPSTTPLATVDLSAAATPTSIAASMGYLIVGSEDGTAIIDPHSGAWAERTTGWPKTLSTSTAPALTDNDVIDVAAGLSDTPAYDPRTGGPHPTFALQYGTGADSTSLIKDDGNVWDRSTAQVDIKGVAIFNGHLYYSLQATNNNAYVTTQAISAINADDWAQTNDVQVGQQNQALGSDNGISIAGSTKALAGALGFSQFLINEGGYAASGLKTSGAMINRTYNSGYLMSDIRGAWLANSKTVDRSYKANTLTENGTVTEGAVESGAELLGYSGWSASNNLTRASDADWDVMGTGSFYISMWIKSTTNSANADVFSWANGDSTLTFYVSLYSDGKIRIIDDGATAQVIPATAGPRVDDSVWHKVDVLRVSSTERYIYIDSILVTSNTTDSGSISSSGNQPLWIGVNQDGSSNPAATCTLSLIRLSATIPSANQIRQMYDAEKGLFVASAECLLQSGSTDAVLDVNVDPLTNKVLVTQTDAITVFDGLVVDSKPTVNSGSSEKGKLWGDLRSEQNSANAYVTAPATDQRQVNEMVRGLANDMPGGVDLSKAKAWIHFDGSGTVEIDASYNVKSLTDNSTGQYTVEFGIPFKSAAGYALAGMCTGDANGFLDCDAPGDDTTNKQTKVRSIDHAGSLFDPHDLWVIWFGELENE